MQVTCRLINCIYKLDVNQLANSCYAALRIATLMAIQVSLMFP